MTGGRFYGNRITRWEDRLVAEEQRIITELGLLADSGLTDDERGQVEALLHRDHQVSMSDLRDALRSARSEA
jgi:hypothetical protein